MDKGYTQASNAKKKILAKKMVQGLTMKGDTTGYGGGMKYRGTGKNSGKGSGMAASETGKDKGYAHGMKPEQSNTKKSFSRNYTQNGEC